LSFQVDSGINSIVEQKVADAYGRFLILKVLLNGEQNLSGKHLWPKLRQRIVTFYLSLLQTIVKNDFETIENIIMGGDFNCPLNPTVEKKKWKPFLKAICN